MRDYLVFFLVVGALIVGCTPLNSIDSTSQVQLPPGLEDCKLYDVYGQNGNSRYLQVIRCPNSDTTTTYPSGKSHRTATVISGPQ